MAFERTGLGHIIDVTEDRNALGPRRQWSAITLPSQQSTDHVQSDDTKEDGESGRQCNSHVDLQS